MNELIRDFTEKIQWEKFGISGSGNYRAEVKDAVVLAKRNVLLLTISLNFVIPSDCEEKISSVLRADIPTLSGVEFSYIYGDLEMTDEEAVRVLIPKIAKRLSTDISGSGDAIVFSGIGFRDGSIIIPTVGSIPSRELNKKAASKISEMINAELGISAKVIFENDENKLNDAKKNLLKASDAELERISKAKAEMASKNKGRAAAEKASDDVPFKTGRSEFVTKRRAKNAPAKGNIIMGEKPITGTPAKYGDISPELGDVVVSGIVFGLDARTTKKGTKIIQILITDRSDSMCLKSFVSEEKWQEITENIRQGDFIKAKGSVEWDRFENEMIIMIDGIEKSSLPKRTDTVQGDKRVELHCHTTMSSMDGLNDVSTLVKTAVSWGQKAIAITDHGVVQSFPDAAKAVKKLQGKDEEPPLKLIYGMEGYLLDDADCIQEDGSIDYKKKPTFHIILLAATQEGLKNLYKLVSMSHLNYFYKKPRLPRSVIDAHREGLIIGSACEAGEVYQAVLHGAADEELDKVASYYDYLEIQPLINNRFMIEHGMVKSEDDLKAFNKRIIESGNRIGRPTVATTDSHYTDPEDAIYRNVIMAGMGYKDAENGRGLYMRTTNEMLDEFSYLGEELAKKVVIENTNKIADMISSDILPVPKGKFPPHIEGAETNLRESCMNKAHEIYGEPLPQEIAERLEKELNSIIGNGYSVMYVSAQMLVKKSLEDGYLVGSRGSVGSSLAATMAGITEVNPLDPHYVCPDCKHLEWGDMQVYDCGVDMPIKNCPVCGAEMKRDGFTIPFATFLGFNGDKEPDIDLNFAGEYQSTAHKYVGKIFGEDKVFKAGTVSTIQEKTAFGYARKFCEERNIPVSKFEVERLKQGCGGVKRTTGQHPGGIVILPEDHEIYEFCPVQHPANDSSSDIITTHFDYHKIDENLLKLDILGHNVPSMIRQLQDMTGVDPLNIDLTDRKVLSIFNGIEALAVKDEDYKFTHGTYAIPEFGTPFVRQMLDDIKPERFADLVRISGFSHGTDVWRNNAQDYILSGTATMREVISTRDDIMNYLILKGIENKTSFQIMEDVRKNRPLKEEQLKVMKEHDVPDWYIDSCIKIQYMFPRAHAVAYTMMSFRMAWYKVYYPKEFYATYFTSVAADFDANTILRGKDSCMDTIKDIIARGDNATPKEQNRVFVYEVAYEMYSRGFEFMKPKLGISSALKFGVEDGRVILPFGALEGVGEAAATALASAFSEKPFDTVEDAITRAKLNKTAVEALREQGIFDGLPETDQLSFFSM